jgi:uncharacterized protein YkwD
MLFLNLKKEVMRRIVIFCLALLAMAPASFAQHSLMASHYTSVPAPAPEDPFHYLSENEKEVIRLINMARINGKKFAETFLQENEGEELPQHVQELKNKLASQPSMAPLQPALPLYKAAWAHARDMGKTGKEGHKSTSGLQFYERIHMQMPGVATVAENIHYGTDEPILIVLEMLTDFENNNRYRENILDPDMKWVGVSIQPHQTQCYNTVMDFAFKPELSAGSGSTKLSSKEAYYRPCPQTTKVRRKKPGLNGLKRR